MKIDLFYEIVSQCMINGVRLAAAFFLYRLLSDFVNKKSICIGSTVSGSAYGALLYSTDTA